jgi:hypothetical protein
MIGCDAQFFVRGSIRYVPSVSSALGQPAILCEGRYWSAPSLFGGGPYVTRDQDAVVIIFCGSPEKETSIPYEEMMLSSTAPHNVHLFAWLEPAPAEAAVRCQQATAPTIRIPFRQITSSKVCGGVPRNDGGTRVDFNDGVVEGVKIDIQ